ncbi:MAG: DUF433 domain-containing protein [Acidobacteriota bacterium]
MTSTATENPTVVRTERGLTVKGTRLTLYDIMDCVVAGDSRDLILSFYPSLTEKELDDVLNYIEMNREEVEAEYQQMLKRAEEVEAYWRERNRDSIKPIDPDTLSPERRALWEKLQAWKERLSQS